MKKKKLKINKDPVDRQAFWSGGITMKPRKIDEDSPSMMNRPKEINRHGMRNLKDATIKGKE